jgi:hypothetical protein
MESKRHVPRKFFAETREHWPIMSVYERFEQIVAIILSLVIAHRAGAKDVAAARRSPRR